jgi:hypothetical protein
VLPQKGASNGTRHIAFAKYFLPQQARRGGVFIESGIARVVSTASRPSKWAETVAIGCQIDEKIDI